MISPTRAADYRLAAASGLLTPVQAERLASAPPSAAAPWDALLGEPELRFLDWLRALPETERADWLLVRRASLDGAQRVFGAGLASLPQVLRALEEQILHPTCPCLPIETILARRGLLDGSTELPTVNSPPAADPRGVDRTTDTIVAPPEPAPAEDDQAHTLPGRVLPKAPASASAPAAPAGKRFGKYVLQQEVGRGGSGTVYRAWQTDLNRTVAIKMLTAGDGKEEDLRRFHQEAILAARLRHPHIGTIYEVGVVDGVHYLAMEFVDGPTLKEAILSRALDLDAILRRVRDVARALEYAHGEGVIHRDIKPENIMIAADRTPRVMDFGLARQVCDRTQITVSGTILGTPAYMSPEQANGDTHLLDGQTDVYSLGAVLYYALAGKPPFAGSSLVETVYMVIEKDPPPLTKVRPDLPAEVVVMCETAMEKDRARRYAGAAAFADDLDRYLNGDSILARPCTWTYRMRKKARKHPGVVRVACLALVLLSLGGWVYERRTGELADQAAARERETRALEQRVAAERERREQAQKLYERARFYKGKEAVDLLDQALAVDPRCGEALYLRAQFRRDGHDFDGALKDLDALLAVDPDDTKGILVRANLLDQVYGDHDRAMAEYDRLLRMDVKQEIALCARGRAKQVKGDNAGALEDFTAALKLDPQYVDAWVNRGAALAQLGRLREALRDLRKVAMLEPGNHLIYYWLGTIHHWTSDYEEALGYLDQAIQRNPVFADAHLQRGLTLSELGRLQEAEDACRKASELRPRDAGPMAVLGFCQLQRGALPEAQATLERSLQLDPKHSAALNNFGLLMYDLRKYPESLDYLDRALAANPNDAICLRNRARTYIELGKYSEAIADCERALAINPFYPDAYLTRGFASFWLRKYVGAIRCYEKFMEMAPNDRYLQDGVAGVGSAQAFLKATGKEFVTAREHQKRAEEALAAGRLDEARASAAAGAEANPSLWTPYLLLSRIASKCRDFDAAHAALLKAREKGYPYITAFLQTPEMDAARADERIRAMGEE